MLRIAELNPFDFVTGQKKLNQNELARRLTVLLYFKRRYHFPRLMRIFRCGLGSVATDCSSFPPQGSQFPQKL